MQEEVTQILDRIDAGDPAASDVLLPLVYAELRAIARRMLNAESAGQTLQATALVHEAYLRLVGQPDDKRWENRGHFFAAAAESMRRILVDIARRKKTLKHGGQRQRVELTYCEPSESSKVDLLELNDALDRLAARDSRQAELVKLRYFAGLTIEEAAQVLRVSIRTANNDWEFARTWLRREMA
jgi:RNA polymerase sigma factor (TIGR02999 family)